MKVKPIKIDKSKIVSAMMSHKVEEVYKYDDGGNLIFAVPIAANFVLDWCYRGDAKKPDWVKINGKFERVK